jgi:hypothetical protein
MNFLVNLHHVKGIKDQLNAKVIMSTGEVIPLSEDGKKMLIETLNKFIK